MSWPFEKRPSELPQIEGIDLLEVPLNFSGRIIYGDHLALEYIVLILCQVFQFRPIG